MQRLILNIQDLDTSEKITGKTGMTERKEPEKSFFKLKKNTDLRYKTFLTMFGKKLFSKRRYASPFDEILHDFIVIYMDVLGKTSRTISVMMEKKFSEDSVLFFMIRTPVFICFLFFLMLEKNFKLELDL